MALAAALPPTAALAGPPFLTDDPEPTDTGHWENYLYAAGVTLPGGPGGEGGLDLNWGAAHNLQINLVLPAAFAGGAASDIGIGQVEFAVKYRFLRQAAGSATPDVTLYPRVFLPTASDGFGDGRAQLFLPLWAQKDFGPWSVFGGGGWEFNPGPGERNPWMGGVAVTRDLSARLTAGIEVYGESRSSLSIPASTLVNFGVIYKVSGHWSLLASGGPGLENTRQTGGGDFYLSLEAQY